MKKLLIMGTLVLSLSLLLAGCNSTTVGDSNKLKEQNKSSHRFIDTGESFVLVKESFRSEIKVVQDSETKILYIWDCGSQAGGLTPWLNSEGNPMKGN